jgi:predicted nucleotide-binding protein (sugar kinase/HSP70/actin superfamily)
MEKTIMNTKTYKSIMVILIALAVGVLFAPGVFASDLYSEADYPAQYEKTMDKLHVLHGKVFDKTIPAAEREKAKREFFKHSQEMVKSMHARTMTLDVKKGASLSHTEVLLSTHLQLMVADMLSSLQQEAWADADRLSN